VGNPTSDRAGWADGDVVVPLWRSRFVAAVGAALLLVGLAVFTVGVAWLIVVDAPERLVGLAGPGLCWPTFDLGWPMLIDPENPGPVVRVAGRTRTS
jgi:hypothetical protein